jgi:hypothetical protein
MTTTPTKKPALERHTGTYLQWWQVQDIAEEEGVPIKSARVLLGPGSEARIYLKGRTKPLYLRRVVLVLLGLSHEVNDQRKL